MTDRILVVEDDLDGQVVVGHILSYLNHPIDLAYDAVQAETYLFDSTREYRAVIIDLSLPGKTGWELLKEIQEHPGYDSLLCVAVTAYHSSRTREEALKAGFDAYFSKPIDPAEFAKEFEALF